VEDITRRKVLGLVGGLGVALVPGCSSGTESGSGDSTAGSGTGAGTESTPATPGATAAGPAAGTTAGATCNLSSEVTEGPYWLTDHPEAANLVHDRQGVPLALTLSVVNAACRPIGGAKVDIWHCDASGEYAGVDGGGGAPGGAGGPGGGATRTSSENWLQGWQTAGSDGTVTFATIYPGWYRGRAVHIHLKVFVGGNDIHTGQLFFPDDLSRTVFANAPYRGDQNMLNSEDNIFRSAGSAALLDPRRIGSGYAASAQLVVQA
jgi:protocatechuate 3,4-dioxygenase beta subunit